MLRAENDPILLPHAGLQQQLHRVDGIIVDGAIAVVASAALAFVVTAATKVTATAATAATAKVAADGV